MSYKLFLDDVRNPPDVKWIELPLGPWVIVRNFLDFKVVISNRGLPSHVSFDHDLAAEHYDSALWRKSSITDYAKLKEQTGYDCAYWMTQYCIDFDQDLPSYTVHSLNPVGKDRILALLEHFKSYRKSTIK